MKLQSHINTSDIESIEVENQVCMCRRGPAAWESSMYVYVCAGKGLQLFTRHPEKRMLRHNTGASMLCGDFKNYYEDVRCDYSSADIQW
jgi:hypothetical protein